MEFNNPISKKIWEDRYRKDKESVQGNLQRVANHICQHDKDKVNSVYQIMNNGYFIPGGRTMSNSGIGDKLTLNNCFVPEWIEDSMDSIFEHVKIGAITQKFGGGLGYSFTNIRPKGEPTSNDAIASGVVSFMKVFDAQTDCVEQGGRRKNIA